MNTRTKVFFEGDTIPMRLDVPIRVPIPDIKTKSMELINCYTTGRAAGYLLRRLREGIHGVWFADFSECERKCPLCPVEEYKEVT